MGSCEDAGTGGTVRALEQEGTVRTLEQREL